LSPSPPAKKGGKRGGKNRGKKGRSDSLPRRGWEKRKIFQERRGGGEVVVEPYLYISEIILTEKLFGEEKEKKKTLERVKGEKREGGDFPP